VHQGSYQEPTPVILGEKPQACRGTVGKGTRQIGRRGSYATLSSVVVLLSKEHKFPTGITIRVHNLLAAVLADGSVDSGTRYTVTFTEDPAVVERLVKEFSRVGGHPIKWSIDKLHNSARARAYGKPLTELLRSLVSTTRTRKLETHPRSAQQGTGYPRIKLPREIFDDSKTSRGFLRYYSTCDGGPDFSVYKRANGWIQIDMGVKVGCANPYLRRQLRTLLTLNGITTSEASDGLDIKSLRGIETFSRDIGFLRESKVRRGKLFRGIPKNDVVSLMVLCRKISLRNQWINRKFGRTEELEGFLRACVIAIKDRGQLSDLFGSIGIKEIPNGPTGPS
jgi:hypothetical protein